MIDPSTLAGASIGDRPVIGIAVGDQQVWPSGPQPFVGEWPGDNGDPWPVDWDVFTAGGATATVDGSSRGRLQPGATTNGTYVFASPKGFTAADVDMRFRVTASSDNHAICPIIRWGGDATVRSLPPQSGFFAYVRPTSWINSGARIYSGHASTPARLDSLNVTGPSGDFRWRFQAVGTTVRLKWWDPAGDEPGSWAAEVTSSAHASGRVAIGAITPGVSPPAIVVSEFSVESLD